MLWSEAVVSDLTTFLESQLAKFGSLPVPREDLVGEVILRLFTSGEAREIRSPRAYGLQILKNLIRDHLRKAQRAQRAFEEITSTSEVEEAAESANVEVEDADFLRYLLDTTDLSSVQAQVVHMMYQGGLTITETAHALKRNPGTIKRHHDRAIDKMAQSATFLERRTNANE